MGRCRKRLGTTANVHIRSIQLKSIPKAWYFNLRVEFRETSLSCSFDQQAAVLLYKYNDKNLPLKPPRLDYTCYVCVCVCECGWVCLHWQTEAWDWSMRLKHVTVVGQVILQTQRASFTLLVFFQTLNNIQGELTYLQKLPRTQGVHEVELSCEEKKPGSDRHQWVNQWFMWFPWVFHYNDDL